MGLFRRARRPAAEPTGSAPTPGAPSPDAPGSGPLAPGTPSPGTPSSAASSLDASSPGADAAGDAVDAGPRAWEALAPLTPTVPAPVPTFKTGSAVRDDLVAPSSPRLTRDLGHLVSDAGPPGVVSGLATLGVQRRPVDSAGTAGADVEGGQAPTDLEMPVPRPPHEPVAGAATGDVDAAGQIRGTVLVPRIVATPEAAPDRRPVEGSPLEAPARHLPLVTPPDTTRPAADPSVSDDAAPPSAEPPGSRPRHGTLGPPTETSHGGSAPFGGHPLVQRTPLVGPAPPVDPGATHRSAAHGTELPIRQRPPAGRRTGTDSDSDGDGGGDRPTLSAPEGPTIVAPERAGADLGAAEGAGPGGTSDPGAATGDSGVVAPGPAEVDAVPHVRPTLGVDGPLLPLDATTAGPTDGATDEGTAIIATPPGDAPSALPLPAIQRRALDDASAQATPARRIGPPVPSAAGPPPGGGPPMSPAASGARTTLPLAAQRSLAAPAPLASAVSPAAERPPDAGPTVVAAQPTSTAPHGPAAHRPVVQRWPDLSGVGGAGRDTFDAAARNARDRARDALPPLDLANVPAPPSLPAPSPPGWPDTSGIPGLPSAPSLPSMPSAADLPSMPSMPAMPSAPGMPSTPGMPTMPGVPSAADLGVPSVPVGVPMTEITFPSPGGSDDQAATASPSTPGAAGGAGGAGAEGDLDELAHKLYDRIRWRMRSELRLDRERAGLGAGVRR